MHLMFFVRTRIQASQAALRGGYRRMKLMLESWRCTFRNLTSSYSPSYALLRCLRRMCLRGVFCETCRLFIRDDRMNLSSQLHDEVVTLSANRRSAGLLPSGFP